MIVTRTAKTVDLILIQQTDLAPLQTTMVKQDPALKETEQDGYHPQSAPALGPDLPEELDSMKETAVSAAVEEKRMTVHQEQDLPVAMILLELDQAEVTMPG
jgi:hypothetical protein